MYYRAIDINGKKHNGYFFGSYLETIHYLKKKELIAINIYNKKENFKYSFKSNDSQNLNLFCKQLNIMLGSGLSIVQSLDLLYLRLPNSILKESIKFIKKDILEGTTFANSLRKSKYKFPNLMIDLIEIGESNGALNKTIEYIYNYFIRRDKIYKKIKSAMIYPIIVFIVTIIVTAFIINIILPSINGIVISMGGEISSTTKFILKINDSIKNNIIYILSVIIGYIVFRIISKNKFDFTNIFESIVSYTPIINRLAYLNDGFNILFSLYIMIETSNNLMSNLNSIYKMKYRKVCKNKFKIIIDDIQKGYTLSQCIKNSMLFDEMIISLISIGEESNELPSMIKRSIDIIEEEMDSKINTIITLIQPLMIIIVSIIVGFLMYLTIIPMYSAMSYY